MSSYHCCQKPQSLWGLSHRVLIKVCGTGIQLNFAVATLLGKIVGPRLRSGRMKWGHFKTAEILKSIEKISLKFSFLID